jgi:hypothetical protein
VERCHHARSAACTKKGVMAQTHQFTNVLQRAEACVICFVRIEHLFFIGRNIYLGKVLGK